MNGISNEELNMFWKSIYETLKDKAVGVMSSHAFDTWFSDLHLAYLDENKAVLSTPKALARSVIMKRYEKLVTDSVREALDSDCTVELICDGPSQEAPAHESVAYKELKDTKHDAFEDRFSSDSGEDFSGDGFSEDSANSVDYSLYSDIAMPKSSGINPAYTFDTFVVGSSNQMAYSCCKAVADDPHGSRTFNPLFIYGPSGLGKTHLMYAIANEVLKKHPDLTVICTKSEDFLNELLDCMSKKKMAEFKAKYRRVDMLMIDDIQFISGKPSTQLEFFHTFDALIEANKQIVVTSDRPPKEMYTLEERIKTRFTQGMIIDVQPPEYELRLAILRKKAEKGNISIPTDVITFLAERLNSNVREIEGAIKKIGAVSFLSGKPITLEMVKSSIPEYFRENKPVAETVDTILEVTARKYDVTVEEILGKSRVKNIKTARNMAMYVIKTVLGLSLPAIGRMMNRDYSTVHSNIASIEKEISIDDKLSSEIQEIIAEVKNS